MVRRTSRLKPKSWKRRVLGIGPGSQIEKVAQRHGSRSWRASVATLRLPGEHGVRAEAHGARDGLEPPPSPASTGLCRVVSAALVGSCQGASRARRSLQSWATPSLDGLPTARLPGGSFPHPPKAETANDQELGSGQGPNVSPPVYGQLAGGMGRGVRAPYFSFQATPKASWPSRPTWCTDRGGLVGAAAGAPTAEQRVGGPFTLMLEGVLVVAVHLTGL